MRPRILLIEDDDLVARVYERVLRRIGDVQRVSDTYPGNGWDVIVADLSAVGPGFVAGDIPIIFVTGFPLDDPSVLAVGRRTVLQKPVDLAMLERLVLDAVGRMTGESE